ncbi:MAG: divalent metal cation transporter, partial [Flavitalea sp.]
TITGTLAGQIIMEGYLRLRINPLIRRLLTRLLAIVPAMVVILIYGENEVDTLLIFSQVILSMQLGFAVIPLIHFVSDKKTMGIFAIKPLTQVTAWLIASILVYLNVSLVFNETSSFFQRSDSLFWKMTIIIGGLLFALLLLYTLLYPMLARKRKSASILMHSDDLELQQFNIPEYKKIAVALDFSANDQKLLSSAIGQGKPDTQYLLIHIVESPSARLLGGESDDYETLKDQERMESYQRQLQEKGFQVSGKLGFKNRTKELARIIKEEKADLLIIGAHGHSGLKDWLYGETIDSVRHALKIPVLVVNL